MRMKGCLLIPNLGGWLIMRTEQCPYYDTYLVYIMSGMNITERQISKAYKGTIPGF